ncbi:MAG: SRPBCC family protein [Anaerolineales bacterium]|nr:SRPBCC family protein [Anaerolineales bacterium]
MATVLVQGQISTSAEKLWARIKNFDLTHFVGFVHTVEGEGVGTIRKFDMGKGEIAEQIEQFDPIAQTLTYTILYGPMPVQAYHATMQVMPGDETSCTLTWSAVFEPKDVPEDEAKGVIEGTFKMNIKALNKIFAYA